MKIVFVLHGFPPECVGGTERVVESLARELLRRGHEVHVIAGSLALGSPAAVTRNVHDGIPVTRIRRNDLYFDDWDKGWHPGVADAFRAELQALKPDLVHVHHWIRLSRDLVRTAVGAGFPVVASLHDYTASCPRTFSGWRSAYATVSGCSTRDASSPTERRAKCCGPRCSSRSTGCGCVSSRTRASPSSCRGSARYEAVWSLPARLAMNRARLLI